MMTVPTRKLFEDDAYQTEGISTITEVTAQGVILDQTIFYAESGGQPGDTGILMLDNAQEIQVIDTKYLPGRLRIIHILEPGFEQHLNQDNIGASVSVKIDWTRRYQHMKMHSAMHILCGIIPNPVTGCAIHDTHARLDFDAEEPLNKEDITHRLMAIIDADLPLHIEYITEDKIKAEQDLVRTVSAALPEQSGAIRMVTIKDTDYQPCGGTHVRSTAEIGEILVNKIKKKSKHARRVNVVFAD